MASDEVLAPTSALAFVSGVATLDTTQYSPFVVGTIVASGLVLNDVRKYHVRSKVKDDITLVQKVINTHDLLI